MTAAATRFDPEGLIRLLSTVLAGAPKLSGAACRGRHKQFDDRDVGEIADDAMERHTAAINICYGCPELDRCTAWTAGLRGRHRPGGVIAAQLPKPSRPRKEKTRA